MNEAEYLWNECGVPKEGARDRDRFPWTLTVVDGSRPRRKGDRDGEVLGLKGLNAKAGHDGNERTSGWAIWKNRPITAENRAVIMDYSGAQAMLTTFTRYD